MAGRSGIEAEEFADAFVEVRVAGEAVKGEYRCAECGYGVVVLGVLPECPMCRTSTWEPSPWRPLGYTQRTPPL